MHFNPKISVFLGVLIVIPCFIPNFNENLDFLVVMRRILGFFIKIVNISLITRKAEDVCRYMPNRSESRACVPI